MTREQLAGRCHSPSGGPLLHQVCIYTLYIYIYIFYHTDIPVVSTCIQQPPPFWTWSKLSNLLLMPLYTSGLGQLWQVFGGGNLSALTIQHLALLVSGAYQLLGASHTAPTPPVLFSLRFSGSCFSIHIPGYQQNPPACSHTGELQEFKSRRTIALNLCYILFLHGRFTFTFPRKNSILNHVQTPCTRMRHAQL